MKDSRQALIGTSNPPHLALVMTALRSYMAADNRNDVDREMNDRSVPERPRIEPEIIPPGDPNRWPEGSFRGTHRVYVTRVGPFGMTMGALAIAFLAVVTVLLLFGAFLIAIPLAGLLLGIAMISALLRGSWQRRT
jgi:hypothetical protein